MTVLYSACTERRRLGIHCTAGGLGIQYTAEGESGGHDEDQREDVEQLRQQQAAP